jgi:hypothetical protein
VRGAWSGSGRTGGTWIVVASEAGSSEVSGFMSSSVTLLWEFAVKKVKHSSEIFEQAFFGQFGHYSPAAQRRHHRAHRATEPGAKSSPRSTGTEQHMRGTEPPAPSPAITR